MKRLLLSSLLVMGLASVGFADHHEGAKAKGKHPTAENGADHHADGHGDGHNDGHGDDAHKKDAKKKKH